MKPQSVSHVMTVINKQDASRKIQLLINYETIPQKKIMGMLISYLEPTNFVFINPYGRTTYLNHDSIKETNHIKTWGASIDVNETPAFSIIHSNRISHSGCVPELVKGILQDNKHEKAIANKLSKDIK